MYKKFILVFLIIIGIWQLCKLPVWTEYEHTPDLNQFFVGDSGLVEPPISKSNFQADVVGGDFVVVIPLNQPTSVGGFSVFFRGNQDTVSSYLPKDFDVFYTTNSNDWVFVDEARNYKSNTYKLRLDENKLVTGFKIAIKQAEFDNMVRISDLEFYTKHTVTFVPKLISLFSQHSRGFLSYLWYSLVFFVFMLVPGCVVLHFVNPKNTESNFIFAPLVSVLSLGIFSTLFIISDKFWVLDISIVFFAVCLVLFLKLGLHRQLRKVAFPLSCALVFLAIANMLQAKRDFLFNLQYVGKYLDTLDFIPLRDGYVGYHMDNTRSWGIARSLLHQVGVFSQEATKYRLGEDGFGALNRTPLLSLISVPILKFFGESHFIYQRFLTVLISFNYIASFLVVKKYFSKYTAKVVSLLLLLSSHLTFFIFNVELYHKFFAFFPILLALILLKDLRISTIGLLLALSVFIHPMGLIFTVTLSLVYLVKQLPIQKENCDWLYFRKHITALFVLAVPSFSVFLGWWVFSNYIISTQSQVNTGIAGIYLSHMTSLTLKSLPDKFLSIVNIFIPDFLLRGVGGDKLSWYGLNYAIRNFVNYSIIAVVSPLFFVLLFFSFIRKKLQKYKEQLWLGFTPVVLIIISVHTYLFGILHTFNPFFLPLIFGVVVELCRGFTRRTRIFMYFCYICFGLLPIYYSSGIFTSTKYCDPAITLLGLLLFGIYLALCPYLIFLNPAP